MLTVIDLNSKPDKPMRLSQRELMNSGKTIFAQLMDFLPTYEFRNCVEGYQDNYKLKRLLLLGSILYAWLSRN